MQSPAPALPRPAPAALERAIEALRARLGERVSTATGIRAQHGKDPSYHAAAAPDVVVFPISTEEVAAAVAICAEHRVPMVPFGAGTSLEGHIAALAGGVCMDLSTMNQIVRVCPEDFDVTVEAGVTREQLNRHLRPHGLFFPIDPGANATLGGMASTRASGTNAVRYGTMRDSVLGLEVVLPSGQVIHTGTRARKSAAGYDLTRLFVGAEGTLGIITRLVLRVHGVPEHVSAAVCAFPDLGSAVRTVIETIQWGVPVARIELLDEIQIDAINRYSKLDLAVLPTLFFELHGSERGVAEQVETLRGIAAEHGGQGFRFADEPGARDRLWKARHDAYHAALALDPSRQGFTTDVCVPISRLADCILETKADLAASGLVGPIVGHVGDGNFHTILLINPDDPEELHRAHAVHERMVRRALAMEGTCTGEHGIGSGKIEFLAAEHGAAVDLMRALKQAVDPHGLMNPGKLLPPRPEYHLPTS
jgi:D-lactate dehydrogenase (cytochrome)